MVQALLEVKNSTVAQFRVTAPAFAIRAPFCGTNGACGVRRMGARFSAGRWRVSRAVLDRLTARNIDALCGARWIAGRHSL
jgi:hypothetical protein